MTCKDSAILAVIACVAIVAASLTGVYGPAPMDRAPAAQRTVVCVLKYSNNLIVYTRLRLTCSGELADSQLLCGRYGLPCRPCASLLATYVLILRNLTYYY